MTKYTVNSLIVIVALYAVFAGVSVITVVLGWASWSDVQDWLQNGALIAGVFLVVNLAITWLASLVSRQQNDAPARKTKR